MYNVYIVSYVKAALFMKSVSILFLVADIIFSPLDKWAKNKWPKMDSLQTRE